MTPLGSSVVPRAARRGLVLFAVLILVGSAVLVATAVVFIVGGEVAGGANEREVLRLRAAGLSAVETVAAKLGAQRSVMLEGGTPLLDETIELWDAGRETASARLLPVDAWGSTLVAESGKVPLGAATIESLVDTGAMDEGLAGRVLALRDAGPRLLSVDAMLASRGGADGLTVSELLGPPDSLAVALSADGRERRDRALEASVGANAMSGSRPVRDLVTTFAFEPPVQSDGSPRVRLDGEWTDDRRGGIDAILGGGSAALLESAMKEGSPTFGTLFAAWRSKHADPREWHAFLDACALGEGPFEDRLDVLRATPEALRSLPGISKDIAERIVREREGLPAEQRRSIAWLAEREIIDAETCAGLVERATTRSFVWRVRVHAALARNGEPATRPGVVFEAVIDCSAARPRVALLRDLSALDTVATMLASAGAKATADEEAEDDDASDTIFPEAIAEMPPMDEVIAPEPPEDSASTPPSDAGSAPAPPTSPSFPSRHGVGRWRRSQ
ncbi:MAG: helix-hairpin-helix domain-containing protein [Phycisphaerae bacterium]|nr:helix-hairpin-helix domain-containing protein [Phycisphaerae bacterium]